jgi:hypothetical protein
MGLTPPNTSIARYAAEEGRTVSQVMRDLLEAYAREPRLGRGR